MPALGTSDAPPGGAPRAQLFHAVSPGSRWAPTLLVHVNGDAAGFATRLRELSREVEPDLALQSLQPLDLAREQDLRFYAFWVRLIAVVSGIAMLLGYGIVMTAVCLSACVVPTRRALRVEPSEALRADG